MLSVATVAVALGAGLGAGGTGPEAGITARHLIDERAATADAALVVLRQELTSAVEAARGGSARVVAGNEAPGPLLHEAAALVTDAGPLADEARAALAALERARFALRPDADPLPPAPDRAELGSLATQFASAGDAGDGFMELRQQAASVALATERALAALEAADTDRAAIEIEAARSAHDVVAESDLGLPTLPVWLETTGEMIGAMERIVEATRRGDPEAAEAAAAEFASLSEEGVIADRALRIAIGEGGSGVTGTPTARLASVLSQIDELRLVIGSVREAGSG